MSVQVLVITLNNHKSIRISIRRSINTYINTDVSINTGISISNISIMICIRRYVCFRIILDYMKSTNILIHECLKKYVYFNIVVCIFMYIN